MKIIHCADLHLNSKMETHFDLSKSVLRKKEILNTFVKMVDYASQNQVEVIILAGDTFDNVKVNKETIETFLKTIEKHSEITFLYLSGNHDEKVVFGESLPENLKLFNDYWTKFVFNNVEISGIELTKSNYIVASSKLDLDKDNVNIVVMHGQVTNTNPSNFNEINLKEYKNKNIDYLALGHIHEYRLETLDSRGVVCYSGTLEGRGFDETGEKGFSLIEINGNKLKSKFVPFNERTIEIINIDISNTDNQFELQKLINKELKDKNIKNIIRIELVGSVLPTFNKSLKLIEEELSKEFFYIEISDKHLKIKLDQIDTSSISLLGEFSRLVIDSKLDEKQKEYIISLGFKVLNGEDIEIWD